MADSVSNTKAQACAYCGEPASTRDHIPPSKLFTPPLPSDLITVPACKKCNNGASSDDEIFRNELAIMAGSFDGSANAAERLRPSVRSIKRNKAVLKKMMLAAHPVERYSPGGIFLGTGVAVPTTPEVHQRVTRRIVRGLYWRHLGTGLNPAAKITLSFIDKLKPDWERALTTFHTLRPTHVMVGDGQTFQYLYGAASDDPTFSFWLLIFFKGAGEQIVLALTSTD